jgi:hypothetical protein
MFLLKPNLVPNLKLGCSFWCSSTFSLYRFCASWRLYTSWTRTSTSHMAWSLATGFMTLCTPWMSNLGCKPWFAKKKMLTRFMNALSCCRQLCNGQKFWPIILMIIICAPILFKDLIDLFCLPICLGVESWWQLHLHT